MCGLFGYVALQESDKPDLNFLAECAEAADTRGSQAHGLAQVYKGEVKTWRSPGSIADNLDCLGWVEGASAVIGHTRFSTSGPASVNSNNQPLDVKWGDRRYAFAHNGTINSEAWKDLKKKYHCKTDCDSELIARYAPTTGFVDENVGSALRESIKQLEQHGRKYKACSPNYAMLALFPRIMYFLREGNPLYLHTRPDGLYLCSLNVDKGEALDHVRPWFIDLTPDTRESLPDTPKQLKPKPAVHWSTVKARSNITGEPTDKDLDAVKAAMDPLEYALYSDYIYSPPTDIHCTRRDAAELALIVAEIARWENETNK